MKSPSVDIQLYGNFAIFLKTTNKAFSTEFDISHEEGIEVSLCCWCSCKFILVIFVLLQMSVRIYSCIFSPSFPISPFVSNRKFTVHHILLNGFHINLATASSVIFFYLHRVACVSWACCSVCQSSREYCTSQWKSEPGCGKSCLCYEIMFTISVGEATLKLACQATVYLINVVKLQ